MAMLAARRVSTLLSVLVSRIHPVVHHGRVVWPGVEAFGRQHRSARELDRQLLRWDRVSCSGGL